MHAVLQICNPADTMIKLTSLVLLIVLIGISKADYCQNNFTMGELPGGILVEALSIITTGTVQGFLGCRESNTIVKPDDVKFWFYNRTYADVPLRLDPKNPIQIDPSKKTIFLIHGWLCNVTNDRMPELKNAYLKRYDCNVVGIDWSALSIALYTSSYCHIPGIAELIGTMICTMNSILGVDLDNVHVLGHSMGGQISGLAGQVVQRKCDQMIGRITGLDPAGPLYQLLPKSKRLDASDAQRVDVIHTNEGFLGFLGPCGHVDFFPNCGTFQPGCLKIDNTSIIQELLNLPVSVVGCNHLRSSDYMIESINPSGNVFEATSCVGCPLLCIKDIIGAKQNILGEDCSFTSKADKFHLKTHSKSPFARDYCQNNQTLSQLPSGILAEALSIATTGTINDFTNCSGSDTTVTPNDVNFWFYNQTYSNSPILLDPTNPVLVNPNKPTIFLIHGWLCNITDDRIPQLKNAYLQRYDCNIVAVDWSALSIALYTSSYCHVPGVAELVGALLCKLNSQLGVNMDNVHVVGHSMGGQISGLAGQEVQLQCGKQLGRITGLDPAGPLYQTVPANQRLDATDATHVDVIHTNEGFLGYLGPCGDVDFFPNCGTFQPGCLVVTGSTLPAQIVNLPISVVNCNHLRSCDLMIESINPGTKLFKARSCTGCPALCAYDVLSATCNVLGEDCTFSSSPTNYLLTTNSQSPFAQG